MPRKSPFKHHRLPREVILCAVRGIRAISKTKPTLAQHQGAKPNMLGDAQLGFSTD